MGRPSRFSPEVRERAVRMVEEHREAHASEWAALQSVAPKLGCTAETLRKWVRQAERDTGQRPGLTTSERERLKASGARGSRAEAGERDSAEGVRVFRPGGARPPRASSHDGAVHRRPSRGVRGRADLRACCRSPRRRITAIAQRQADPTRGRRARNATTRCASTIQRVYDEHHQVYGPRKVWKQLRREGIRVARCTVGRLMRAMGLAGAVRGRAWITTTHAGDGGAPGRPGRSAVRGDAPESALGVGLHLRRDVERLRLRGLRHRRLRAAHRRAGACRRRCAPTSCSTRWSRRSTHRCDATSLVSCITVTEAASLGSRGRRNACAFRLSLGDFEVPLQAFSSRVFFAADC